MISDLITFGNAILRIRISKKILFLFNVFSEITFMLSVTLYKTIYLVTHLSAGFGHIRRRAY
jgi:hypothetical protein